jgi:hypothetical protein
MRAEVPERHDNHNRPSMEAEPTNPNRMTAASHVSTNSSSKG